MNDLMPLVEIIPVILPSKRERAGQLEWLTDLRDEINAGHFEAALEAINGAIKTLERIDTDVVTTERDVAVENDISKSSRRE